MPKIGCVDTAYAVLDVKANGRKVAAKTGVSISSTRIISIPMASPRCGWRGISAFRLPITARGTDLNLIPQYPTPRTMICEAAAQADGLITVCQALKDRLIELGTAARARRQCCAMASIWSCSADRSRQGARRRSAARRTLGSVGMLIERKGHHHVIARSAALPDTDLLIVGEGPERAALERLAAKVGVAERVRFLGADRADAARRDLQCDGCAGAGVCSGRLGQCASGSHGLRHAGGGLGRLGHAGSRRRTGSGGVDAQPVDAEGVIEGVAKLFATYPDRAATRRYAEGFSWDATTQGQLALFRQIIARRQPNNRA